jgi:methionyl-tRNA synthetase
MDGRDAWFLTGLDEHGQKVAQEAQKAGITPQQWVDGIAPKYHEAWETLEISHNDFIRTTEPRHIQGVQRFFTQMQQNGYIYQDTYAGYYCVPDETFFTDEQLAEFDEKNKAEGQPSVSEDGAPLCPDCQRPLTFVQEDNLFFRLSAFQDRLLAYYEENPSFICPEIRRNEVVSFVRSGLKDLSVSRTTFDWGVPITFAPGHVSYVWVDALINYITAIGYGSDDPEKQAQFKRRWPSQVQFVGKDISRFHCVIWPAMLMAADIEPPEKVFAHGFLLTQGEKMSKSRGNAMSPAQLCKIFSVDGYRFYFLTDVQFGADGSISLERMAQVYNADLANSWGNLCSRAFNMTSKYFDGVVPTLSAQTAEGLSLEPGNPLASLVEGLYERYAAAMEEVDYSGALAQVKKLVDRANLYVEESAPWNLAKAAAENPAAADQLAFVLYNILEAIRIIALFFAPVMPTSSTEVFRRLGLGDVFATSDLKQSVSWGGLPAGNAVEIGAPLFPRLKEDEL